MSDELIKEYAEKLKDIYLKQTAGSYTFSGLLSEFTRKLKDERPRTKFTIPVSINFDTSTIGIGTIETIDGQSHIEIITQEPIDAVVLSGMVALGFVVRAANPYPSTERG